MCNCDEKMGYKAVKAKISKTCFNQRHFMLWKISSATMWRENPQLNNCASLSSFCSIIDCWGSIGIWLPLPPSIARMSPSWCKQKQNKNKNRKSGTSGGSSGPIFWPIVSLRLSKRGLTFFLSREFQGRRIQKASSLHFTSLNRCSKAPWDGDTTRLWWQSTRNQRSQDFLNFLMWWSIKLCWRGQGFLRTTHHTYFNPRAKVCTICTPSSIIHLLLECKFTAL